MVKSTLFHFNFLSYFIPEIEDMTAKEITTQALAVQEQSLASTARTKQTLAETKEVNF